MRSGGERDDAFLQREQLTSLPDDLREEITAVQRRTKQAEFESYDVKDFLSPAEQSAVGRRLERLAEEEAALLAMAEYIEPEEVESEKDEGYIEAEFLDRGKDARDEQMRGLVQELRLDKLQALAAHIERVYNEQDGAFDWRAVIRESRDPVALLIKHNELSSHLAPGQIYQELQAKNPALSERWLLLARKQDVFPEEELFTLAEQAVYAQTPFIRELIPHGFSREAVEQIVVRGYREAYALGFSIESCLGRVSTRAAERPRFLAYMRRATGDGSFEKDWWKEASDLIRLGGWTKEETHAFLQEQGMRGVDTRRLFGIPLVEGMTLIERASSLLRPFTPKNQEQMAMKKEWTEFVTRSKQIDEVVESFSERVLRIDVESDRETRRTLRSARITGVKEIADSTTAPLLLALEGTAIPAVYKTPQREPDLVKDVAGPAEIAHFRAHDKLYRLEQPVIDGVKQFEAFRREWLCSVVDRIFDFELVPPLVLREGPEGVGMVQKWEAGFSGTLGDWKERMAEEKIIKLAVFHYLVWHCDGHNGNFNVTPEGEFAAFDNGYSFSSKPSSESGAFSSDAARHVAGKPIPLALRKQLRYITNLPVTKKILQEAFSAAFRDPRDAEYHLQGLFSRLDFLAPEDESYVSRVPASQKGYN